jgi:hypothetical protein
MKDIVIQPVNPTETWYASPPATDGNAPNTTEIGQRFTLSVAGQIEAVRKYRVSGAAASHKFNVWNSGGTRVGTFTSSGESGTGWFTYTLTTPIQLTPGTYTLSYGVAGTQFSYTLTAPAESSASMSFVGAYNGAPNDAFPNSAAGAVSYMVEPVFRPDTTNRGGISLQYVEHVEIERCDFVDQDIWAITIGVLSATDNNYRNEHITIKDCTFTGMPAASTYEQLLIYNSKFVSIRDCTFTEIPGVAIGLGLYQLVKDVEIVNCVFEGADGGNEGSSIYYSMSCNDIRISECDILCRKGIEGANLSDNGDYGHQWVNDILITGCVIVTTADSFAIQLGSVKRARIYNNTLSDNYGMALKISKGNSVIFPRSRDVRIAHNTFQDNNVQDNFPYYHPGILIQGVDGENITDYRIVDNSFITTTPGSGQLYGITVDSVGATEPYLLGNRSNHQLLYGG